MPCDSSGQAPRIDEIQRREAANILILVYQKTGVPIQKSLREAAKDLYGTWEPGRYGDPNPYEGLYRSSVRTLCEYLVELGESKVEQIVQKNFRSKYARQLMDWWKAHKKADYDRLKKEIQTAFKLNKPDLVSQILDEHIHYKDFICKVIDQEKKKISKKRERILKSLDDLPNLEDYEQFN